MMLGCYNRVYQLQSFKLRMADFLSYLQAIENLVGKAGKGLAAKVDQLTFRMVINGLKGTDYEAVSIIIDQLVKEKRPASIPPLYVVAKSHPDQRIRKKAEDALHQLDPEGDAEHLAHDKPMADAVKALVEHFGNYKQLG